MTGSSLPIRLDSVDINDLLHNDRLVFVTVGLSTVLMESEHKIHFKMKISHFPCQNLKSELAALRDER